ncbi:MAG: DUF6089 family protein [Bacteroidia bacterium]|nr:DUF6089 family protein [Bacteroidia bacterium]
MKLFHYFLFLSLVLGCVVPLPAQRSIGFSAGTGTAYYYGDLTDNFNNSFFRPAIYLSASTYITSGISLRCGISFGQIRASDARATSEIRRMRNLRFRSLLGEMSFTGVYEFFPDKYFGVGWRKQTHFSPYIFGGVAVFGFDPRAKYQDKWIRLKPLGTEGQYIGDSKIRPYSLIQPAFPFGGGINLRLTDFIGISMEMGYRITFTDYLDDVSTFYPDPDALAASSGPIAVALSNRTGTVLPANSIRGNPGVKDSYVFTTLSVCYYLDRRP